GPGEEIRAQANQRADHHEHARPPALHHIPHEDFRRDRWGFWRSDREAPRSVRRRGRRRGYGGRRVCGWRRGNGWRRVRGLGRGYSVTWGRFHQGRVVALPHD